MGVRVISTLESKMCWALIVTLTLVPERTWLHSTLSSLDDCP